ncbi:MAG: DUF4307 domain-containing protein [Pseudonocardiaceae bacterium]|nr:DUF4307 domain-containing protein [Pseudonocardiaceae bacterium]
MTTSGAAPVSPVPEGRYGSRAPRRPRRWRSWLFTVVALVVATAVAIVGYRNIGSQPIEAERTAYDEVPGNAMRMTFTLTRDKPDRPAVCVVRVQGRDGAESGRREVFVPPAENGHSVSALIRSSERPVTADVFGCSYEVPVYLTPG